MLLKKGFIILSTCVMFTIKNDPVIKIVSESSESHDAVSDHFSKTIPVNKIIDIDYFFIYFPNRTLTSKFAS